MSSTFSHELRNAAVARGDVRNVHAQGTQRPGPMVLGDLLLRDAVQGALQGLLPFHPVEDLYERIRLRLQVEGGLEMREDFADEEGVWGVLCQLPVNGDVPAIRILDENSLVIGLRRVLMLGQIGVDLAERIATIWDLEGSRLGSSGALGLRIVGDEIRIESVARLGTVDLPVLDGVATFGVSGAPLYLEMGGEREEPVIRLVVGFPWHRITGGLAGGQGPLVEDVRGAHGVVDFLLDNHVGIAAEAALAKLDAGAIEHGQLSVGFGGRVDAIFDDNPLDAIQILEAITEDLPSLAAQRAVAQQTGDEASLVVLDQGLVDLVARLKDRPAIARVGALAAVRAGLAPHVEFLSGAVYWLPVGQYPHDLPSGAHENLVLPNLMFNQHP